jgi:hypothetical protein
LVLIDEKSLQSLNLVNQGSDKMNNHPSTSPLSPQNKISPIKKAFPKKFQKGLLNIK